MDSNARLNLCNCVLVGCFAVMEGEMTTGALVACSIYLHVCWHRLQITGVLGRLQQAKVAKQSLDELMQRPIDQPERSHLVHKAVLNGDYELKMSCSNMAKKTQNQVWQSVI